MVPTRLGIFMISYLDNNNRKSQLDMIGKKSRIEDPIIIRKIGRKRLYINKSHMLPTYLDLYPFYDRALPRICKKLSEIDGELKFIDVGANIGDTVSLISDFINGSFLCIEGDVKYLPILRKNALKMEGNHIEIEPSYCGPNSISGKPLTAINKNGTAKLIFDSNDSSQLENIYTLDNVIKKHPMFEQSNILKIDTDGFEINVLKGASALLKSTRPVLFIEFTPQLYRNLEQEPLELFSILSKNGYKSALFYDNFGKPIKIVNLNNLEEINKLISDIDNKHIYYYDILTYHETKNKYDKLFENELISHTTLAFDYINRTNSKLIKLKEELNNLSGHKVETSTQLISLLTDLDATKHTLCDAKNESKKYRDLYEKALHDLAIANERNINLENDLSRIQNTKIWKIAEKARYLLKIVKPDKVVEDIIQNKVKLSINHNSKKLVYVGHSYHEKTRSTKFLIDYLKEYFDVEVMLDESWMGKPSPKLDFVDESYLGVVFFQNLPSPEIVNNIQNANIIFFPMYDGSWGRSKEYWEQYKNIKYINFSRTLHEKMARFGLESLYIQFFPKPGKLTLGKLNSIFFWQRLTHININTLEMLLPQNIKYSVHLHQAIDPEQKHLDPSTAQKHKFQFTFSKWFKSRSAMLKKVADASIYVAPREYEGIGLSYLEAMAMGKAVIAVNNPTMNEYIENNKTGYLFDINNPRIINLDNLRSVQKNCYKYIKAGYKEWEKDKKIIIDFIKK